MREESVRGTRLRRFLEVFDMLSRPGGATAKEIGRKLGSRGNKERSAERAAYRNVALVRKLGFPVRQEVSSQTKFSLHKSSRKDVAGVAVPEVNLSSQEIIALYLLWSTVGIFQGTGIEKEMGSAFEKLGAFLPEGTLSQLDRVKSLVIPTSKLSKDYSGMQDVISRLAEAILEKRTCRVRYHRFYDNEVKEYRIDPLHLFENDGGLYLFVRKHVKKSGGGEIRTLAVERIRELKTTRSSFSYPDEKEFDPENPLGAAFDIIRDEKEMAVKIWFSGEVARYIKERKWSQGQRITPQGSDGAIIFEMETSGKWEVKKWVLSYGPHARVLEPEDLRQEIMKELDAARKAYP